MRTERPPLVRQHWLDEYRGAWLLPRGVAADDDDHVKMQPPRYVPADDGRTARAGVHGRAQVCTGVATSSRAPSLPARRPVLSRPFAHRDR
jgi:hypothetical protein